MWLYCFARQVGPQRGDTLKTVWPNPGGLWGVLESRSEIADKGQGACRDCIPSIQKSFGIRWFHDGLLWFSRFLNCVTVSLEQRMLHQIVNIFHLVRGSVSAKQLKILLCVSLEGEPGPCPKLDHCFLTAPLFCPHPLPFLITNCLNLPFGTQGGHGVCMKHIFYKQETEDTERLPYTESHRVPLAFIAIQFHSDTKYLELAQIPQV